MLVNSRLFPRLLLLLALAGGSSGCPRERSGADAAAAPRPDVIRPLVIEEGKGLLFSFFDHRAVLTTVESLDEVEDVARTEVIVTDPARRLPGDLVYLADLRKVSSSGNYRVWVEPRGRWLDRAMPKLSLLAKAQRPDERSKDRPRRRSRASRHRPKPRAQHPVDRPALAESKAVATAREQLRAPDSPERAPRVVLFSTSWCPSCRTARQYLTSRGVPFADLDVEKDMQARQRYQAIEQRFGLRPGVVPLIVIDDRPFQGFSQPQLEAALAAAPRAPRRPPQRRRPARRR